MLADELEEQLVLETVLMEQQEQLEEMVVVVQLSLQFRKLYFILNNRNNGKETRKENLSNQNRLRSMKSYSYVLSYNRES